MLGAVGIGGGRRSVWKQSTLASPAQLVVVEALRGPSQRRTAELCPISVVGSAEVQPSQSLVVPSQTLPIAGVPSARSRIGCRSGIASASRETATGRPSGRTQPLASPRRALGAGPPTVVTYATKVPGRPALAASSAQIVSAATTPPKAPSIARDRNTTAGGATGPTSADASAGGSSASREASVSDGASSSRTPASSRS